MLEEKTIVLEDCPFCGSSNVELLKSSLDDTTFYWVLCRECGAEGPTISFTEEKAAESWNTRVGSK